MGRAEQPTGGAEPTRPEPTRPGQQEPDELRCTASTAAAELVGVALAVRLQVADLVARVAQLERENAELRARLARADAGIDLTDS